MKVEPRLNKFEQELFNQSQTLKEFEPGFVLCKYIQESRIEYTNLATGLGYEPREDLLLKRALETINARVNYYTSFKKIREGPIIYNT